MTGGDPVHGLAAGLLRGILGGRLERVQVRSADANEVADRSGRAGVMEIDHGVVLSTSLGTVVLDWCIDGYYEYLNVAGDPGSGPAARVPHLVEVSECPGWRDLVGLDIASIGVADDGAEDGGRVLWSVRFEMEAGRSVSVALGELLGDHCEYKADNLVAIFGAAPARAYSVGGTGGDAWGRDLLSADPGRG